MDDLVLGVEDEDLEAGAVEVLQREVDVITREQLEEDLRDAAEREPGDLGDRGERAVGYEDVELLGVRKVGRDDATQGGAVDPDGPRLELVCDVFVDEVGIGVHVLCEEVKEGKEGKGR